jgi:cation diffusion facilitator family transporter
MLMTDERFKRAAAGAWFGIAGNLVLALVKFVAGWLSGSKALIADAVNSASDVAGAVAVLIGLKAAKKPPDDDHPYGHGKAESVSAIVVSMLVIVVGVEVGLNAVEALWQGEPTVPPWYTLVVVAATIIAKEAMFQYTYRLGKRVNSQALIANAWDHRSDVFASSAVFVGVGGAMLGGVWNMPWLGYLDPIAGILVALLVIRMGFRLIMESIHNTLDHVLHEEDAVELRSAVESVKGVLAVDDLRAREHGHYVVVDVKISVNPRISVLEGHDIARSVKQRLLERFPNVSDVFTHVNPYDPGYPYKTPNEFGEEDRPTLLH